MTCPECYEELIDEGHSIYGTGEMIVELVCRKCRLQWYGLLKRTILTDEEE